MVATVFLEKNLSIPPTLKIREGTFHTKVAGDFRPGEKWQVGERLSATRFVFTRENERKTFDLTSKGKWSLYDTEEMVISAGDQIRITEGFRERGVAFRTNDIAKVKAVELGHIELEDGRRLKRDFAHIDQGVCITSYASECRTVRQVVAIAPLNSFAEMHAKTFYVLASRATHRAVFFTDCKEAFKEAASGLANAWRCGITRTERHRIRRKLLPKPRTKSGTLRLKHERMKGRCSTPVKRTYRLFGICIEMHRIFRK